MHLDRDWVILFPELNPGIFGTCFAAWKNIICVMFSLHFVMFFIFIFFLETGLAGEGRSIPSNLARKEAGWGKSPGQKWIRLSWVHPVLPLRGNAMNLGCSFLQAKGEGSECKAASFLLPACLHGGGQETGGACEWWGNKKSSSSSLRPEQIIRNQGAKAVTKQMCCIG